MLRKFFPMILVAALCASAALAQDSGEAMIKKALEGRQVLVKMDLPAVDTGIPMVFDDANVTFDNENYNKLLKQYGVGIAKDSKARITGASVTSRGIEIQLNGGGSPSRDWMVAGLKLAPPVPADKSYREVELERMIPLETNALQRSYLINELEMERQERMAQDLRNQEAYQRMANLRTKYIEENRSVWGSKFIVTVHSRNANVSMKDMVRSLSKYIELLPRDKQGS
ncbi:MAG: hypothetical protein JO053_07170 [Acidobacteria bacterium]|nr:hypothetical protein [Acidobacteriota bacterium]